ncbi:XrtA/PEP-CTERM system histidine kinase PrsK [Sandarakinorhabdus sp.]|uniref:XrtA/PEP-CTERM system histidine kinase PrsK n=1 Tax=Sandarakinorhabdus sp. TaxID=1916663 RepID=UPI00334025C4
MIQLTDVGLFSHFIAMIAYLGLAVAAVMHQRAAFNLVLAAAALATAAWAASFVATMLIDPGLQPWISRLQTLKIAGWIALLLYLLRPSWLGGEGSDRTSFWVGGVLGFVLALQIVVDFSGAGQDALIGEGDVTASFFLVVRIAVSVTGLVLSHNLFVNSREADRSGIRLLAIGLAGLFVYDLNFYTLAFLLPPGSPDLYNIRGAVDAILVLLFLFSTRDAWMKGARVSRTVAFQTFAFSGVGFYLIAMSLLAYALKLVGGDWGVLLQVTFLCATLLMGTVALVSPRMRAWLRVAIARNFYRYQYDYRNEWLRFIATVSAPGEAAGLPVRVVQALATVLDAQGGWLLVPEDIRLQPMANWQMADRQPEAIAVDSELIAWLSAQDRTLDLELVRSGEALDPPVLPDWLLADRRFWLAVPAVNRDTLAGVVLIGQSLVPRRLGWEDEELLRTLGRQIGSYIAESSGQAALEEAQRFEEFNRRFAFILHDIKNLVSQLSLLARNAERHADNPAFRADMIETLKVSVGKMNALLAWLSQRASGVSAPDDDVPVDGLLRQLVKSRQGAWPSLSLNLPAERPLPVRGDGGRLEQMFAHLLQNAMDASPPGAPIRIDMAMAGPDVVITLADRGQGMSARFIRQDLFQPFHSTKPGGFGIGAYEAREIARAHGGRLDVASREGEGTSFTISLPMAKAATMAAGLATGNILPAGVAGGEQA